MALRLVILDRDGVINRDSPDYIRTPAEWHALPGSLEAIARLNEAGYTVGVASNQSGVARGYFDEATLRDIFARMRAEVAAAGGRIDHVAWCPHGPDDGCDCRKPAPGLLHRIGAAAGVPLDGVPCIGDSVRDIEAAMAAGARPMLVRTGNGREAERALRELGTPVEIFDDLDEAASALVREAG